VWRLALGIRDVAVYIGALQRHRQQPTVGDIIRLNRVLKLAKRKPCVVRFPKMEPPLRMLVISDSEFERLDTKAIACEGRVVGLAGRTRRTITRLGGGFATTQAC
jgi:hypothetical protein